MLTVTTVIKKEIKKSYSNGLTIRKKMASLKIVYKGPDLDHTSHNKTHNKIPHETTQESKQQTINTEPTQDTV